MRGDGLRTGNYASEVDDVFDQEEHLDGESDSQNQPNAIDRRKVSPRL